VPPVRPSAGAETAAAGASRRAGRTWHLRNVDLFEGLTPAEAERLAATLGSQRYRAGRPIVDAGSAPEAVHVVLEGSVRLFYRVPGGRETTVATLARGRVFGLAVVPDAPDRGAGPWVMAATDAVVGVASGRDLRQLVDRHPDVVARLIQLLVARLVACEQRLDRLAAGDVRARLASLLAEVVRRAGGAAQGADGTTGIDRPPTHVELAREIGASRETVTRALSAMEAEGLLRREGRRLVIPDPERLVDASTG